MNTSFKTKIQEETLPTLYSQPRIILRWATGLGKSKMTIDLVNHTLGELKKPPRIAFIVAERSHIKNWQEEFEKWGLKAKPLILCYASLKKLKDNHVDILVLDEAHHVFTEKRMAILETLKAEYVYLLSATLSVKRIIDIESIYGKFTTSTVTLKEAIRQNALPEPRVNLIPLELEDKAPTQTIVIGKSKNAPVIRWEERGKYIYKNIPCVIRCTEKQKYLFLTEKMEYWKRRYELSHNQMFHNIWVNTGSTRKRFLGELKTEKVRKLISEFPWRKRFICFCASIAQAEALDPQNTISSKRPSSLNQQIIDAFNKKQLHRLYAIGMATEGLNLNNIEVGIIVQLDGKERLFVQKFGRSLRAEDPVSYIFYYKDTQDEVYLRNALENIDNKYLKTISL